MNPQLGADEPSKKDTGDSNTDNMNDLLLASTVMPVLASNGGHITMGLYWPRTEDTFRWVTTVTPTWGDSICITRL
jgi:hypothetical protein